MHKGELELGRGVGSVYNEVTESRGNSFPGPVRGARFGREAARPTALCNRCAVRGWSGPWGGRTGPSSAGHVDTSGISVAGRPSVLQLVQNDLVNCSNLVGEGQLAAESQE